MYFKITKKDGITLKTKNKYLEEDIDITLDDKLTGADATATDKDILLGKTAYVDGEKVEGVIETYDGSYEGNGANGDTLKNLLDYTKSASYMFYNNTTITDLTGYIEYNDTENVTNTSNMFYRCIKLTSIPSLNISKVTKADSMFSNCSALTSISQLDTSSVDNMSGMFSGCSALTTIPQLDTSSATNMYGVFSQCMKIKTILLSNTSKATRMDSMFYACYQLETISQLDIRNITNANNVNSIFSNCSALTNLEILNIKVNIQIGAASSYGHLLTLESLLNTCQECVNVNASRTLTMGTANIAKLEGIYVKLTGEAEVDSTLPKLPMVQCNAGDEGAMTVQDYMALKNWSIA